MSNRLSSPKRRASAPRQPMPVHIRWCLKRDMPEILAIEEASFEFPWDEEEFARCGQQGNCVLMVAERGEQIVGYVVYELRPTRLHLLNFAVHPDFRRHRVGEQLVRHLVAKPGSSPRRISILLEIRETNMAGQLFFREMGFRAVSILRDFYEDTAEDAYLMRLRLRRAQSNPPCAA